MRTDWTALPVAVTAEIIHRVGPSSASPAVHGDHAEIAATVSGTRDTVFIKAATTHGPVQSLRYELNASMAAPRLCAPAVKWHFEAVGWLVVGFEHCAGRHADLAPGSTDLNLLKSAVLALGSSPAPAHVPWLNPAARTSFTCPEMGGELLVHTDLNPTNLIVTATGLKVVDWAFAIKAAAWVELAFLTPWLIGSGHTPGQAEAWLQQFPAWSAVPPQVIDHFAAKTAAKWSMKARQNTGAWIQNLAAWNSQWSAYRRGRPRP